MALNLMYITNSAEVARIAESAGVDRIFVDMEYIGKELRQGGMDTVKSHHTIGDIKNIRSVVKNAELLVRCNPIHSGTSEVSSSKEEIDAIVSAGADVIMLPYFKTASEVRKFVKIVDGRVRTMLLVETPEAVSSIDEILAIGGVDEMFVGLNDLSIGYGKRFMFELLCDGTIENLCRKFREKHIPFGFGGIAALGRGMLPAEKIITEHYRHGSGAAILSRSFCMPDNFESLDKLSDYFIAGVADIRKFEEKLSQYTEADFAKNYEEMSDIVEKIVKGI